MSCDFLNKTGVYLDGELAAAEREAYEVHLSACEECSQELARLQRLSRFLSAAGMPEVGQPGPQWKAQLNRQRLVHFAELLTAAAVLVMAVCGLWLFRMSAGSAPVVVSGWERAAVGQQLEGGPAPEADDPLVQVLLRGQP